jgi:hypothetical protein
MLNRSTIGGESILEGVVERFVNPFRNLLSLLVRGRRVRNDHTHLNWGPMGRYPVTDRFDYHTTLLDRKLPLE